MQYIQNYNKNRSLKRRVIGAQFIGFNNELGSTTSDNSLSVLENATGLPNKLMDALTFQGFVPSDTFTQSIFDTKVGDIIRSGRGVVFNFEPFRDTALATGSLDQINAGSHDNLIIQFNAFVKELAKEVPDVRDKLAIKFLHEGNLSVGAYPWVVFDPLNLGSTYDRFTTTEAQIAPVIASYKTAFERLSNLVDRQYCKVIFELGQDNWRGGFTNISEFFPNLDSFDIVSVNSYNRSQVASGYGYAGTIRENLKSWLECVNDVCPQKQKMIGETATTSLGTVSGFGSPITITSGGTGFPPNTVLEIPTSKIWGDGDSNIRIEVKTDASGVIVQEVDGQGNVLFPRVVSNGAFKGEDLTDCVIGDASSGGTTSFNGGTGFQATVNFRQWWENKAKWLQECSDFLVKADFDYVFCFLENKTGGINDYRDWNLNSPKHRDAFETFVNNYLSNSTLYDYKNNSGEIAVNLCRDRWTTNLNHWVSAGANAGTVDLTTNVINRPRYTPHNSFVTQSMVRLTHNVLSSAYLAGNTRPFDNRLRYFIPFWDNNGFFRRAYRPNDTITIKFKARYKPNRTNQSGINPSWKAPLLVAIEGNNGTNNYERGQCPQIFLTKQMQEYTVQTSHGLTITDGYYLNFMIGNTNVSGEFIMTDVRAIYGGKDNSQIIDDLVKPEVSLVGSTTISALTVNTVQSLVFLPPLASTAVINQNTGTNFVNGAYTLSQSQNATKLHIDKIVLRPETVTGTVTTPPAFSVGANAGVNNDFVTATTMTGAITLNTDFEIGRAGSAKPIYVGGQDVAIRCTTAQVGATALTYRVDVYGRYLPN